MYVEMGLPALEGSFRCTDSPCAGILSPFSSSNPFNRGLICPRTPRVALHNEGGLRDREMFSRSLGQFT